MARLLISVRSASEAVSAVRGGAAIIDVKEPDRGPLGRADASVWDEVREALPSSVPLSVALGELSEWREMSASDFSGVRYRKIGLAGVNERWRLDWGELRSAWGAGPSWIAVAYADWERAGAPRPDEVLDAAIAVEDCSGILVDTWGKSRACPIDLDWLPWFDRARGEGLTTALAGRLDRDAIGRLAALAPDIIAVRGAACHDNDRRKSIDPGRVAGLARAAERIGG